MRGVQSFPDGEKYRGGFAGQVGSEDPERK